LCILGVGSAASGTGLGDGALSGRAVLGVLLCAGATALSLAESTATLSLSKTAAATLSKTSTALASSSAGLLSGGLLCGAGSGLSGYNSRESGVGLQFQVESERCSGDGSLMLVGFEPEHGDGKFAGRGRESTHFELAVFIGDGGDDVGAADGGDGCAGDWLAACFHDAGLRLGTGVST